MSTLRKDPVSGGWVIMAEDRSRRPPDFAPVAVPPPAERKFCPFCDGNESSTPAEILAVRPNDRPRNAPGWSLRVIPNKFAILRIEGDLNRSGDGIYDLMSGIGAHEIVIESPCHDARFGDYSQNKVESVIRAYRDRVIDLNRDMRFKYIQIFRNYGTSAGAMLEHPHSQVIALPITPRWRERNRGGRREYYEYKERCLFCDILNQETKDQSRVVYENTAFLAFTPFASKFPFETWILPKVHSHDFQFIPDHQISPLAEVLRRTLWAIQMALENPPYNFIIHSAPRLAPSANGRSIEKDYHWHIEIIPRVTRMAGFEWGTGFYVNPTLPERAAEFLRRLILETLEPVNQVE
ncbi:MAG: galactose-1-phosphate uridylyltransferase [bacterium]|nr:galactose-1-phosphate uridylyltransferase [bacterium]